MKFFLPVLCVLLYFEFSPGFMLKGQCVIVIVLVVAAVIVAEAGENSGESRCRHRRHH